MRRTARWAQKHGGDPQLLHFLGLKSIEGRRYDEAISYFQNGTLESAQGIAKVFLAKIAHQKLRNADYRDELYAFSMILLKFLSEGRVGHAKQAAVTMIDGLKRDCPEEVDDDDLTKESILAFALVSIEMVQRGRPAGLDYSKLRDGLGTKIFYSRRDEKFSGIIDSIGQLFFGLPPLQVGSDRGLGQGNMLQSLMSSLLGGSATGPARVPPKPPTPPPKAI